MSRRKYLFENEEEKFKLLYEKFGGSYMAIAKELGMPPRYGTSTLNRCLKGLSWKDKYPNKNPPKRYSLTEEEFSLLWHKHNGRHDLIGEELGTNNLWWVLKKYPWSSKYPPRYQVEYDVSEEIIAKLYEKHSHAHNLIEKELGFPNGALRNILTRKGIREKYPPKGNVSRFNFTENQIKFLFITFGGSYPKMARHLKMNYMTLYKYVRRKPWGHKYIIARNKSYKKNHRNKGQYQDAVSSVLNRIQTDNETFSGYLVESCRLGQDINDLLSDGLSLDEIACELKIEKAIVKRYLSQKEVKC